LILSVIKDLNAYSPQKVHEKHDHIGSLDEKLMSWSPGHSTKLFLCLTNLLRQ